MRIKIINIIIAAAAVIMIVCAVAETIIPGEEIYRIIEREEYGQGEKTIKAVAEIGFEGELIKKEMELTLGQKALSQSEKLNRLEKCKTALPDIIKAGNLDLEHISEDMDLITYHEKTGVSIMWDTDEPELISSEGNVYPGEKEDNGYVLLTALLSIEGEDIEFKCNARHTLKIDNENYSSLAEYKLSEISRNLEENGQDDEVELPKTLGDGISVEWKKPKEYKAVIAAAVLLAILLFLKSAEKGRIKNDAARRKEDILMEFPGFLDKLVMLLSAGMILSKAVEHITADYKEYVRPSSKKILYEELCVSVDMMKNSNASFQDELTSLAKRLEIREFARLAVILKDSLDSGMELADKLEKESLMMRYDRRNRISRLGKTADSKLVFPLIIILLALIVIVMTPAVMQI